MKNKFNSVKLFLVFVIPLFLFQNCSENIEETETKQLENSIELLQEEAYPGFKGEIVTINYRGIDIKVMKKGKDFIFQGDIIITQEDLDKEQSRFSSKGQSAVQAGSAYRWSNKTVYYTINSSLPSQFRVTDAIAHWEANTELKFFQRTTQSDYIEFIPAGGCYSDFIGKKGGRQEIGLSTACSTGNTMHEIGHAIGLFHEQTRDDRDNYIQIHYNNISSGLSSNFDKYSTITNTGVDVGSFDLGSIMMYGSYFFSSNGQPTITKLDGSTFSVQRDGLSSGDIAGVYYLYPAPSTPPPTVSISGPTYMGGLTWVTWTYNGSVPNAQTYKWWYKKTNTNGAPYVIGYGSSLFFSVVADTVYSSDKSSYFEIYLEVTDSNGDTYTSGTSSIMKKGKWKEGGGA